MAQASDYSSFSSRLSPNLTGRVGLHRLQTGETKTKDGDERRRDSRQARYPRIAVKLACPQDKRPKSLHRYLAHNVLRTEVFRKAELFMECDGGGLVLRIHVLARVMNEGDGGSTSLIARTWACPAQCDHDFLPREVGRLCLLQSISARERDDTQRHQADSKVLITASHVVRVFVGIRH